MQTTTEAHTFTLKQALEQYTVSTLRGLAKLLPERNAPMRKDLLIAHVARQYRGEHLLALWRSLGPLEQAAVAEALYDPAHTFHPDRFHAKYGEDPFSDEDQDLDYSSRTTRLDLFLHQDDRHETVLPEDLARALRPH